MSAGHTPETLLVADGLHAGYVAGVNILSGCSLELRAGEIVGVIGPNGAGKSTLLKAIFGLVPVASGVVRLAGEEITGLPAHALVSRGVGYVPQDRNVFASLTVQENLEMGIYLQPRRWEERFGVVREIFPLLAERRNQLAGSLSGGERRMVAMARTVMMEPAVLLLDEPSAGLAPANQDEAFGWVREINAAGASIVIVEQNARRCLQICHRAYVLDQGRNAHTGTGQDLLHDPKVVDLYLGTLARAE
ncbi:MAG: ABC transporter ATP-binding protein [Actinomycetota bacterium]|nr:ABC transporter ATP-binding protein [Actinomycetota bacterium]